MRACSPMLSPAVPSERTPTCPATMAGSSHNGHQYSLTVEQRFEAPLRFQRKHFYSTILLRHCVPGCIFSRDVSASVSAPARSEEHTSELQSRGHLVCRLLLEKK